MISTKKNLGRIIVLTAAFSIGSWMVFGSTATAAVITNGFTFAVASDGSDNTTGTHFHSSTAGDYGNPAGKAEVGRYSIEEVRGLSEYDLASLSTSPAAFVSFEVYKAGGLFAGTNDFPFDGSITVFAYDGNNAEDESDYQAASIGTVGSFSTSGLVVGNTLSFDITTIFNNLIGASADSLGIRLAATPLPTGGAWTFDGFRLTSENLTTPPSAVPAPPILALALLCAGLVGFGMMRRRRF